MKTKTKRISKNKSHLIVSNLSAFWLLVTGDFLKSFLLLFVILWISYLFTKEEKAEEVVQSGGQAWPAVLALFLAVLYGTVQLGAVQADGRPFFSSLLGEKEPSHSLFGDEKTLAETDLMIAASTGDTSSLKRFIEEGANLDHINEAGETALHYAVYNSQVEAARLLLSAGANPNIEDNGAYTPLGITYSYNNVEMAGLLSQFGADSEQKDSYGESIRSAAAAAGNERFLQALQAQ